MDNLFRQSIVATYQYEPKNNILVIESPDELNELIISAYAMIPKFTFNYDPNQQIYKLIKSANCFDQRIPDISFDNIFNKTTNNFYPHINYFAFGAYDPIVLTYDNWIKGDKKQMFLH